MANVNLLGKWGGVILNCKTVQELCSFLINHEFVCKFAAVRLSSRPGEVCDGQNLQKTRESQEIADRCR